ncbi:MAG: nuclear transport factor 2 family protein [Armatimonadetes bacterium]|nr:nuclear transport factor 2 family protein [Armatimonadota bacterium]
MKRLSLVLAVASLAVASQAASTLRQDIESMNKKIAKTFMAKDMAAFEKLVKPWVTSDFKYIEEGKTMNFKQMVDTMKQGYSMMGTITKVDTKILTLTEKGSTANEKSQHTMAWTSKGQDGKSHAFAFVGTSTNTYKKVNGKWLLAVMSMKTDKMTMDGKAMDMSKMGG